MGASRPKTTPTEGYEPRTIPHGQILNLIPRWIASLRSVQIRTRRRVVHPVASALNLNHLFRRMRDMGADARQSVASVEASSFGELLDELRTISGTPGAGDP